MTSTIEGNNSVGSLLEPLLKKVTPVVGSRMLCMFCNLTCDSLCVDKDYSAKPRVFFFIYFRQHRMRSSLE
jgi:hypothetical protein